MFIYILLFYYSGRGDRFGYIDDRYLKNVDLYHYPLAVGSKQYFDYLLNIINMIHIQL